jgi:hypothetical protein
MIKREKSPALRVLDLGLRADALPGLLEAEQPREIGILRLRDARHD